MSIHRNQYIPRYILPEERDFCSYFDQLKYEEMMRNPDKYFRNVKVVNFDIIHHQCRGDLLGKSFNEYFAMKTTKDFTKYPKVDKKMLEMAL